MFPYRLVVLSFVGIVLGAFGAAAEVIPGLPYERFETVDADGDPVTYYLTHPDKPAPLAIIVQASGCAPLFVKGADDRYEGSITKYLYKAAENRLALLAVEKNHTPPGSQRPSANDESTENCPRQFLEQDTLDKRLVQIHAAIKAVRGLPWIKPGPTLAIGEGEGSLLVPTLGREDASITDVAQMSAFGGPIGWY